MRKFLVAIALFAAACSAPNTCPAPTGIYVWRFTTVSGTCGDIPSVTSALLGPPPAGCIGEWTERDSCSYSLHRYCSSGASAGLTLDTDYYEGLTYQGGSQWRANTFSVSSDGTAGPACSGTYTLTISER